MPHRVTLVTIWVAAGALGLAVNLAWIDGPALDPRAVAYLCSVGWVGVIAANPQLFAQKSTWPLHPGRRRGRALHHRRCGLRVPLAGSVPNDVGFHEIFHLLVVAAAVTQFVAVSLVVL